MADFKDPQFSDPEKNAYDDNGIHPTTSGVQPGTARRVSITDAVFGEINEDGPNYRAVCPQEHSRERVTDISRSAGKVQLCSC